MAKKAHGNKKQPRLFAWVQGVTKGAFMLCGGPDVDDAMCGINRLIRGSVYEAMRKGNRLLPRVVFRVEEMTDAEVARLESL